MNDLHAYLRTSTCHAHKILDASLISYDLTEPLGLSQYLCVHYLARSALSKIMTLDNQKVSNQKKLNDIELDLEQLETEAPLFKSNLNEGVFHMLGIDYVLAGSSLGSKVLYKHWSLATNEKVKQANHFMTSAKDSADWKTFLTRLDSLKLTRVEIEQVVATANHVFEIYQTAYEQINGTLK